MATRSVALYTGVLREFKNCLRTIDQADPEAGGLTPHEEIAAALALLPRGKHVFLKGVSHAWLHDQPEQGRKAISDFLTAV